MAFTLSAVTTTPFVTIDLEDDGAVSIELTGPRAMLSSSQARQVATALTDYARAADEYAAEQIGAGA
ncbi:hypothetical protein ACIGCK_04935 [Microbacterium sp. NPDC078428]|uniref:hypothetical protein n=1 Tax=Microbacterium sp. NPDC078428 TaxID=3364190 RepID=UPI0037C54702